MQALCLAVKVTEGDEMRSLRRCSPGRWGPLMHRSCLEPMLWTLEKVQEGLGDRSGNSTTWTLPLTCEYQADIPTGDLLLQRGQTPSLESWGPWKHQRHPVDTLGRHWHPLLVQRTSEPSEGKKVLELKSVLEGPQGLLRGKEVFLVICAPEERSRANGGKIS